MTLMTQIKQHEKYNFFVFVINQILVRVGWIFKTETVVMPGFLDTLTPSGAIRGLLPLISRVSQSLPQFLIAHQVTQMPRKKIIFILSAFGFALPWLLLSLVLGTTPWSGELMAGIFLGLYACHWLAYGCNNLSNGTLQGKLVHAEKRGRLLAYSNTIGCTLAIASVWFLMPRWLQDGNAQYVWIFATTGCFFAVAATGGLFFREPPEAYSGEEMSFLKFLSSGIMLLRYDREFRRLAVVISLYMVVMLLFPHYTVFGKRKLGIVSRNFVTLLIVQNSVNALGSFIMGNVADRYGNRIVLRLLIFIAGFVPLLATGISQLPMGAHFYWIVYAFLGFTPVSGRITINYMLEIAPREKHPQYLGVLSLLQAIPLFGSPFLGLLIDLFSFERVFITASLMIFGAGWMTFRLAEPRNQT